jgi:hypothetical protein
MARLYNGSPYPSLILVKPPSVAHRSLISKQA